MRIFIADLPHPDAAFPVIDTFGRSLANYKSNINIDSDILNSLNTLKHAGDVLDAIN